MTADYDSLLRSSLRCVPVTLRSMVCVTQSPQLSDSAKIGLVNISGHRSPLPPRQQRSF